MPKISSNPPKKRLGLLFRPARPTPLFANNIYLVKLSLSGGKTVVTDDAIDSTERTEAGPEKRNADVTGLLQPGGVDVAEACASLVLDLLDLLHLSAMKVDRRIRGSS